MCERAVLERKVTSYLYEARRDVPHCSYDVYNIPLTGTFPSLALINLSINQLHRSSSPPPTETGGDGSTATARGLLRGPSPPPESTQKRKSTRSHSSCAVLTLLTVLRRGPPPPPAVSGVLREVPQSKTATVADGKCEGTVCLLSISEFSSTTSL